MGGLGSGRQRYATTPTVGQCTTLSISSIDAFTEASGLSGSISWGDESDKEAGKMLMHVSSEGDSNTADGRPSRLRLQYHTEDTATGDVLDEYDYYVQLDYTECNFGGFRPWFNCPDCGERVAKLYLPPGCYRFACRECYELGYNTSRSSGDEIYMAELRYKRAFAKADKDSRWVHPNAIAGLPERPKGMHHSTFDELMQDVWDALDEWDEAFQKRSRQLMRQVGD